jgi:hypothetical protein
MHHKANSLFYIIASVVIFASCKPKLQTPNQTVVAFCKAVQQKNTMQINNLLLTPDSLFSSLITASNQQVNPAFFFDTVNYSIANATILADTATVALQAKNTQVQSYQLQLVKNTNGQWRILLPWFVQSQPQLNQSGAKDTRSLEQVEQSAQQVQQQLDSLKQAIKKDMHFKTDQEVEEYLQQVN